MKCPICDWKIEGDGIAVEVGGTRVVVCSEECAEKVRAGALPK
jgi:ribosome-binding protein aMBF1 (putative translation factor)